jgi:hypothetical protein
MYDVALQVKILKKKEKVGRVFFIVIFIATFHWTDMHGT